jgi:RHH-type proline utilization regulon transcriptional repressor/proline dehydrogenase/delta 1-pyrroline-5-carboxylate dehydrogenase
MAQALHTVRAKLGHTYPLWLGDQVLMRPSTIVARNPAFPSQVVGVVAQATAADVDEAVRVAAAACAAWADTPIAERAARLRRAAELMRRRRAELAAWEIVEVGKTWREADADVAEAIDYLEYYSRRMEDLADGTPLIQAPGEQNRSRYLPLGVAAVIAPWNFPAAIVTGMASAALIAGSAVILKPAEQSSVVAAQVAGILREAGLPPDVVQYLPGRGEDVGASLARHPGVQAVLFTGSKAVGLSILAACATVPPGQRFIKRVVAEMGGKNALLIDADADLDAAVAGTLRSAFGYGGQKCSAASRVIVHEAIADRFLARCVAAVDGLAVGDPADPATDLGPLIDATAQERLRAAIARAERVGRLAYQYPDARLPRQGYFVGPVVATEVPPEDPLAQEELFGPLVCVVRAKSFEDALQLANDTAYALTGGVYSRSPSHLERAIQAFDVGNLYLNRPITGAAVGRQPFGGHRLSGLGTQAGGPDYLLHLLIPKTICLDTTRYGVPL